MNQRSPNGTSQKLVAIPDEGTANDSVTSPEASAGQPTRAELVTENIELRAQVAALQAAHVRQDEFLGTLAHELRNPLASISNSLQILGLSKDLSPTVTSVRTIMQRQVNQLVDLVNQLTETSAMICDKIGLNKEAVNLEKVLKRAVESSRPLIDSGNHQLTLTIPSESLLVDADFSRLTQVFTNLLNNAAQNSSSGSQIDIKVSQLEGQVKISIKDHGAGIPHDMLSCIFDLFVQVDSSRRRTHGGLGIGLTLARKLLEMHGGQIEARSEGLGHGSEFIVWLPLLQRQEPPPSELAPSSPREQALGCRQILVVDDIKSAAYVLGKLLEALGQKVETANSADAALQHARRQHPEIVISDISMPGVDGYELARQLRLEPGLERTTLVALTGHNEDRDRQQSKAAGFDHHLVKPVSLDALISLLKSVPPAAVHH